MEAPMTAVSVIKMAKTGVDILKQTVQTIDQLVNQTIPWKEFRETVDTLKNCRDQFSNEAAPIVGEVAKLLLDSSDKYISSVTTVDTWCKTAIQLLNAYLRMFASAKEKDEAEAQKLLLLAVLTDGQKAISQAIFDFNNCNESFNELSGTLIRLQVVFNNDFAENSAYYQTAVKDLRTKAYGGAAVGIVLGPLGLAISYGVAAGIVERNMIPVLRKAFLETEKSFATLKNTLTIAENSIKTAKDEIKQEIVSVKNILSQINTTEKFAEVWTTAPAYMFEDLKKSTKSLVQMCKMYSAHVEKRVSSNWA